jgi:hypothetical protein
MSEETMNADPTVSIWGLVFACFFATWVVLGLSGFYLFYVRSDVYFKRRWFPRYIVLVGVLFVLFSTALTALSAQSLGALGILVVLVPAAGLISWLNIKFTRFCDKCGATVYQQNWLAPMNFCSKCGAELDGKPVPRDDLLD